MESDRQNEAEKIILEAALIEYPNDPDLLGQLGWIYLRWHPRARIEDARARFSRSATLKCNNPSMYWQWWRMEADRDNWVMAVDACRRGIKNCPYNIELQYCLGYSRSRFGKSLELQFQYSRALEEHQKAETILAKALSEMTKSAWPDEKLMSQTFKALVIVYQSLLQHIDSPQEKRLEESLKSKLKNAVIEWSTRLPLDQHMIAEKQRLHFNSPSLVS